jgi:glycosyltransferase involved in cell wall biosynthesis
MTPSPVRVLALTNMFPTASDPGFGAFVADQMHWVQRCGAHVTIDVIDGRAGKWQYVRAITRVRRAARSGQFDLVHAHYGLTGFVATFQPLPLVVSFCGDDLLGTPDGHGGMTLGSRLQRVLSRRAAPRAQAIVCKSEQLRAALPIEADRARAHVLPNGVDTARFAPGDRAEARRRLGVAIQDRLVLFPHTPAVARKRFDLAQAAMTRLAARRSAARLWTVSGVPHAKMPDYYRAADCLLLTSDQEGSPNVVKEALCCDLPVVSVDSGDVRKWIELGPGSVLVGRDPDAIAAGVESVLSNGRAADGSRIREELAAERTAHRLIAIYREAIMRRPTG